MEPTNYPHTKLQQPSTLKSAEMVKSTLTRSQQGAKFPPVRVLSPGAAGLRVMFSHPATPLLSEEVGPSIQTSTRLSPVRVLSTVTIPPPPAPLPSGGAGPSMTKTVPFSPVCVLSTVTIPPPLAPFSSGGAGSSTQTGARLTPVQVQSTVTIPPPLAPLSRGGAGPSMTKTVPFSPVHVMPSNAAGQLRLVSPCPSAKFEFGITGQSQMQTPMRNISDGFNEIEYITSPPPLFSPSLPMPSRPARSSPKKPAQCTATMTVSSVTKYGSENSDLVPAANTPIQKTIKKIETASSIRSVNQPTKTKNVAGRSNKQRAKRSLGEIEGVTKTSLYCSSLPLFALKDLGPPPMTNVHSFMSNNIKPVDVKRTNAAPTSTYVHSMDLQSPENVQSCDISNKSAPTAKPLQGVLGELSIKNISPTQEVLADLVDDMTLENHEPSALFRASPVEPLPRMSNETRVLGDVDNRMVLREVRALRQRFEHAVQSGCIRPPIQTNSVPKNFQFNPLNTKRELEEFDVRLGDDQTYKQNVLAFVLRKARDSRIHYILQRAIDTIFSKQLFANCTWSGKGSKKIPLKDFPNMLNSFKELGNLQDEDLQPYFTKKNRHAKRRLHLKGNKMPAPLYKMDKENV